MIVVEFAGDKWKWCPKCMKTKRIHLFQKNSHHADKLQVNCKTCRQGQYRARTFNIDLQNY